MLGARKGLGVDQPKWTSSLGAVGVERYRAARSKRIELAVLADVRQVNVEERFSPTVEPS
jgi:hypothetical protein